MTISLFRKDSRKPGRHARGIVPVATKPVPPDHTMPLGIVPARRVPKALAAAMAHPATAGQGQRMLAETQPWHTDPDATAPFPAPVPLPKRRVIRRAPGPRLVRPYMLSRVREGVLLTARAPIAASMRPAMVCMGCHREHRNPQADTLAALRESAGNAGWERDRFGVLYRCPRCARRHAASFGRAPIAAIEAGPARVAEVLPQRTPRKRRIDAAKGAAA